MHLVIEELFANTIHHGYGTESDAPVSLALIPGQNALTLRYTDQAPPFNMLEINTPTPSPERLGGAGLHLIRALADAIRYQRIGERNVLELDFYRD